MKLSSQFNCSKPTFYENLFGMLINERSYSSPAYRYGFNGKEKDDEVKGDGNQLEYGMRIYDCKISKFLSVDLLIDKFPWFATNKFAGNRHILAVNPDGNLKLSNDKALNEKYKFTQNRIEANRIKIVGISSANSNKTRKNPTNRKGTAVIYSGRN